MAGKQPHPLDLTAQELSDYLLEEPALLAQAFREGYATPFAAPANEAEKLDYYRRNFFTQLPDGAIDYEKPNTSGRSMLMTRLGPDGYTQAMSVVLARRNESRDPELEPPEDDYSEDA